MRTDIKTSRGEAESKHSMLSKEVIFRQKMSQLRKNFDIDSYLEKVNWIKLLEKLLHFEAKRVDKNCKSGGDGAKGLIEREMNVLLKEIRKSNPYFINLLREKIDPEGQK